MRSLARRPDCPLRSRARLGFAPTVPVDGGVVGRLTERVARVQAEADRVNRDAGALGVLEGLADRQETVLVDAVSQHYEGAPFAAATQVVEAQNDRVAKRGSAADPQSSHSPSQLVPIRRQGHHDSWEVVELDQRCAVLLAHDFAQELGSGVLDEGESDGHGARRVEEEDDVDRKVPNPSELKDLLWLAVFEHTNLVEIQVLERASALAGHAREYFDEVHVHFFDHSTGKRVAADEADSFPAAPIIEVNDGSQHGRRGAQLDFDRLRPRRRAQYRERDFTREELDALDV